MAIKPETAVLIENHLKNPHSDYYLGPEYAHLLDYTSSEDPSSTRIKRLSSEDNHHYWSYLYGGIYIKELLQGWRSAGYSIDERPEIICTLYNVGFSQSHPKPDPQVGGSTVVVNGYTYTFGHLANEFYFSGELTASYPEI
jgi:hypothetical protein